MGEPATADHLPVGAGREWTLKALIRVAWQHLGRRHGRAVALAALLALGLAMFARWARVPLIDGALWLRGQAPRATQQALGYVIFPEFAFGAQMLVQWVVYCAYAWWTVRSYDSGSDDRALLRPLRPARLWRIALLVQVMVAVGAVVRLAAHAALSLILPRIHPVSGIGEGSLMYTVFYLMLPRFVAAMATLVALMVVLAQDRPSLGSALRDHVRYLWGHPGRVTLVAGLVVSGYLVTFGAEHAFRLLVFSGCLPAFLSDFSYAMWRLAPLVVGHMATMLLALPLMAAMLRAAYGLPLETGREAGRQ